METTTEKETKKSNSLFECNEIESVRFRFNREFSEIWAKEKPWIVEHKDVEHTVDEVVSHTGFVTKRVRVQKELQLFVALRNQIMLQNSLLNQWVSYPFLKILKQVRQKQ